MGTCNDHLIVLLRTVFFRKKHAECFWVVWKVFSLIILVMKCSLNRVNSHLDIWLLTLVSLWAKSESNRRRGKARNSVENESCCTLDFTICVFPATCETLCVDSWPASYICHLVFAVIIHYFRSVVNVKIMGIPSRTKFLFPFYISQL